MVNTAAFHSRVRGSVPGLGGLKETKMFAPHPRVKLSIVRSLLGREVACSASDRQGSNFESCLWRAVSSHSSHNPEGVLLAQFSLYVHKDLWPKSRFISFLFILKLCVSLSILKPCVSLSILKLCVSLSMLKPRVSLSILKPRVSLSMLKPRVSLSIPKAPCVSVYTKASCLCL